MQVCFSFSILTFTALYRDVGIKSHTNRKLFQKSTEGVVRPWSAYSRTKRPIALIKEPMNNPRPRWWSCEHHVEQSLRKICVGSCRYGTEWLYSCTQVVVSGCIFERVSRMMAHTAHFAFGWTADQWNLLTTAIVVVDGEMVQISAAVFPLQWLYRGVLIQLGNRF